MIFRENFYFLSNMYPCEVQYEGQKYQCAEAAFQAAKCIDKEDRIPFTVLDGFAAKSAGRKVKLRSDWNTVRVEVMEEILRNKFSNPELKKKLQEVKGNIQEDNSWGDTFWGVCRGVGENNLGKLLMKIRDEASKPKQKQKIYTSYWGNTPSIPKNVTRISICLSSPRGYVGAECKELAPNWKILNAWRASRKDRSAEEAYTQAFKTEILKEENFMLTMWKLARLSQGQDIVLLCYEKPGDFCHRHIVAEWIREHGFPCEEWKGGEQ